LLSSLSGAVIHDKCFNIFQLLRHALKTYCVNELSDGVQLMSSLIIAMV
jgi:hypothetical protein